MNTTPPIIMPIYSDSKGHVEKCLEDSNLADLLEKSLMNEDFTEQDASRIAACVEEKKEANGTVLKIFVGILVGILVALLVGGGAILVYAETH